MMSQRWFSWDLDHGVRHVERPVHHCGVVGVVGVEGAADVIARALMALQHRGEEGAGIVVSDGKVLRAVRTAGLVSDLLDHQRAEFARLRGTVGVGHVRYSTTGAWDLRNVQPLVVECQSGMWALAHNGNLTNAGALRFQWQSRGAIFQTGTDTEVLLHMIAHPRFARQPQPVVAALRVLRGAFSMVLVHKNRLIAARDRHGFRPLALGRLGSGYIVASETCAFHQVGATFLREIEPGEVLVWEGCELRQYTLTARPARGGQCVFEHIYFARPDSVLFGRNVHEVRMGLGRRLAEERPVRADVVVPIPDSGLPAAMGFAQASGIPMDLGFIRNHYIGRSFIRPTAEDRARVADLKLAVVEHVVRGRRVVVVDDSLVRGTTVQRRVQTLRKAGAIEVHLRIASPPIRWPCWFGIDFPTREELIAADRTEEEIARIIGVDSLGYLSLEGLARVLNGSRDYCFGCFTGRYPENVAKTPNKFAFEITLAKGRSGSV